MQLLVNLTISVYFLQMPLTLLLLFEWDVGANVFSWLFAAADRKYIACVCGAIRRHVIEALTVHILSILDSVEFEPKCIPCHWSPENISKRLRRILVMNRIIDDVHYFPRLHDGSYPLVERWYEAMLRLQSLCVANDTHDERRGTTNIAHIFKVCLENMDPFHLSLADPMVLKIFVEACDFATIAKPHLFFWDFSDHRVELIKCQIPHHKFALLVATRDMRSGDLGFTLREVIETCLRLA